MKAKITNYLFSVNSSRSFMGVNAGARTRAANCFSKARNKETCSVTFSAAAFAVEKLLNASSIEVNDGDVVLTLVDSTNGPTYISFDGLQLVSSQTVSPVSIIASIIAWNTSSVSCNETKDLLAEIFEEYESKKIIKKESLYKFCDAFYYELAKDFPEIEIKSGEMNETTAKMAFSNKANTYHPIIGLNENLDEIEEDNPSTENYEEFLKKCKAGDYYLPYDFGPEAEAYIYPLSALDDFCPNETFVEIVKSTYEALSKNIEENETGNLDLFEAIERIPTIVLGGVPGTGKTRILMAAATALGMPFYSIPVDESTERDTFCGVTVIEDGKLIQKPTPFLMAMKYGGWAVTEETNLLSPNLEQGVFGQLLEAPYILSEYGYNTITRHPLSVISFTMNPDTIGTLPLNQAFVSRSNAVYILDNPQESDFVKNVTAKFGNRWTKNQCSFAYSILTATHKFLTQKEISAEDIAQAITPRVAMNFLKFCEQGNAEAALKKTFIGTVGLYNRDIANQLFDVIKDTINLKYPQA